MNDSSKIVIIIASGITTQKFDNETNEYVTTTNMIEIVESVRNEFLDKNIEILNYSAIDSSTADLDFFHDLAKFIQRKINSSQIKGFFFLNFFSTKKLKEMLIKA